MDFRRFSKFVVFCQFFLETQAGRERKKVDSSQRSTDHVSAPSTHRDSGLEYLFIFSTYRVPIYQMSCIQQGKGLQWQLQVQCSYCVTLKRYLRKRAVIDRLGTPAIVAKRDQQGSRYTKHVLVHASYKALDLYVFKPLRFANLFQGKENSLTYTIQIKICHFMQKNLNKVLSEILISYSQETSQIFSSLFSAKNIFHC